jgi:general secretion pathway protein K
MVRTNKQRGIALISVLLITSIATLIISDMLGRQRLSLVGSTSRNLQQQLWQLALSGEIWARIQLEEDWREEPEPKRVYLDQQWAKPWPVFNIDDGRIRIQIQDLSARFNINTLRIPSNSINQQRYQRLLKHLGIPSNDPGSLPPVRGYDGKLVNWNDPSELMSLDGMQINFLERLYPFVRTTPGGLNINTATSTQLATLGQLDLDDATALVRARPVGGYSTVQEFLDAIDIKRYEINSQGLDVTSRYFQAVIDVELGDSQMRLLSRLAIGADGEVSVMQRTLSRYSSLPE